MDNEGIFLRKMIEIWFVGATLAVARWVLAKSYCLTGDRKGRPYEHKLKIVHEVDTFIVHCPLYIVHSNYRSIGTIANLRQPPASQARQPPERGHEGLDKGVSFLL